MPSSHGNDDFVAIPHEHPRDNTDVSAASCEKQEDDCSETRSTKLPSTLHLALGHNDKAATSLEKSRSDIGVILQQDASTHEQSGSLHRSTFSAPDTPSVGSRSRQPSQQPGVQYDESSFGESNDSATSPTEPHEPLRTFDWNDLSLRYHERVKVLSQEESELLREYAELSRSFSIWAQSGPVHEIESSYKRLKTQMRYVRHEEHDLEERRKHYVKVIEAFQTSVMICEHEDSHLTGGQIRRRTQSQLVGSRTSSSDFARGAVMDDGPTPSAQLCNELNSYINRRINTSKGHHCSSHLSSRCVLL